MPQFDTSTFISQLFWLVICLSVVIFCYVRIFIPRFSQTLEKRLSKIRYDLEQAEHMQEQANILFDKNQKKIADAQHALEEHIKKTLEDLEHKKKLQLAHIDEELSESLKVMEKSFERQQLQLQEGMGAIADDCLSQIFQHVINASRQNQSNSSLAAQVSSADGKNKKVPRVKH